jgi:hypothetical protein
MTDARLFLDDAKLFKSEFDGSKPSITFEEFIIGMAKIYSIHGIKVIDELIEKFKTSYGGRRREDGL